jgi:hypothetical protein
MRVRRITSHPRVLSNHGLIALARGPLVYCVEGADHPGGDLRDIALPPGAALASEARPDLLGGVTVLRGEAAVQAPPAAGGHLYSDAPEPSAPTGERSTVPLTAVPYFAWANRDAGQMAVWLRENT